MHRQKEASKTVKVKKEMIQKKVHRIDQQKVGYDWLDNYKQKCNVYVLKLQHGKWYVGKATDVDARFLEHKNGKGAAWTLIHPPISIFQRISDADRFEEDTVTKKYMSKFGIENVRGGSYCQVFLSRREIKMLQRELDTANDRCFRCHSSDHFLSDCPKAVPPRQHEHLPTRPPLLKML